MNDELFPQVKKGIDAFLQDEEGNIPRSKILTVGSLMMLMGIIYGQNIYATHQSHSSHSSHVSGSGSHSSHESHQSHQSHVSASTHSSHSNSSPQSNAAPHSNSAPSGSVPSSSDSITKHVPASKMKSIGSIQTPISNKLSGSLAKAAPAIPAVNDTPKFNK